MAPSDGDDLPAILNRLARQRTLAVHATAFLDDLVSNADRWEKYGHSLAGHVIALQITTVESALMMWFARMWDENGVYRSIPNAYNLMTAPSYSTELPDRIAVLKERYASIALGEVKKVVRIIRSESLAHVLDESRDRERHFPDGYDKHGVRTFDFLEECKKSIQLIDLMILIDSGLSRSYESSAGVFQNYVRSYWDNMPVFKDVE